MASPTMRSYYTLEEMKRVVAQFEIPGTVYMSYPFEIGHINDTYGVETCFSGGMKRYILQRINTHVFKWPEKVMDNIKLVTEKQHESIRAGGGDPMEESLTLVNTREGLHYWKSPEETYWRCYHFIEGACTYNYVAPDEHGKHLAYEASRAFGEFQNQLAGLPGVSLHETIPFFHHTPARLRQLREAVEMNFQNRRKRCEREIAFALEHGHLASVVVDLMEKGAVPLRASHNDTKINNVMFDFRSGREKAKVIIDLDTLMPGSLLYDFGDMVRTTACPACEDERDLSAVVVDLGLFERIAAGFIHAAGNLLTPAEADHLVFSGRLITYTIGIRFLADYLAGDVYFKVRREEHNLDRARVQFKLIEEMEKKQELMEDIVRRCLG